VEASAGQIDANPMHATHPGVALLLAAGRAGPAHVTAARSVQAGPMRTASRAAVAQWLRAVCPGPASSAHALAVNAAAMLATPGANVADRGVNA
jgi:hypothetical protein